MILSMPTRGPARFRGYIPPINRAIPERRVTGRLVRPRRPACRFSWVRSIAARPALPGATGGGCYRYTGSGLKTSFRQSSHVSARGHRPIGPDRRGGPARARCRSGRRPAGITDPPRPEKRCDGNLRASSVRGARVYYWGGYADPCHLSPEPALRPLITPLVFTPAGGLGRQSYAVKSTTDTAHLGHPRERGSHDPLLQLSTP